GGAGPDRRRARQRVGQPDADAALPPWRRARDAPVGRRRSAGRTGRVVDQLRRRRRLRRTGRQGRGAALRPRRLPLLPAACGGRRRGRLSGGLRVLRALGWSAGAARRRRAQGPHGHGAEPVRRTWVDALREAVGDLALWLAGLDWLTAAAWALTMGC